MNKNVIYLIFAVLIGLFAGWLLFGTTSNSSSENKTSKEEKHSLEEHSSEIWTCSMHPQVRQQEPGDCPICGMDLIPAESSATGLAPNEFKMTENAMALANIQTTVIGEMSSSNSSIELSGKIKANDDKAATQPAHFNGRVDQLYVTSVGETVRKGQAVAKIYSPELVAAQQELITAYRIKDAQPQLYTAVKNKFMNWMIPQSQLAEVLKTGIPKPSFTIYAQVSGVVTELMVNKGSHVMDGQPIFKVANLSTVWAEFDAYETTIHDIKEGQDISVVVKAIPNKTFNAKVSFIDPILNTSTRTVRVRATLNNKEDLLKPGMFVTGTIKLDTDNNTQITVPKSAVLWTGEESLVYIKTTATSPTFIMRNVTLGRTVNDNYEIQSGLKIGDEVVTNGTFTVDAAAQLQGKQSMMNPTTGSDTMNKQLEDSSYLNDVMIKYIVLKDALVNSDTKAAHQASNNLLKSIRNTEKLKDVSALKALETTTQNFIKSETLAQQRSAFVGLSKNLIKISKGFSSQNTTYYIQECPMANNNNGAQWLALEKGIKNPYFGEAMLDCGSVIGRL
ncbi:MULTISPECIES: efflux RND transporter periplasmic adaptor subunit [Croceibacter]|uniref:efflux RND transporter periplasmic adaptor subunit n=1 Tax=Croceibacter TaxID=216431 RepID=UPI000C6BBF7C|nr:MULTISPECIES: efflux RND transporter periplasmic adaptor subunit [Croceibacter]MBG26318.1 efflux transporter periplasmic adaptor subunit [Croceibacter sp.]|tara:strand:+ start:15744 stop:17429 length:1686 start_codon:yes stop_codon:yes gene_type:complete